MTAPKLAQDTDKGRYYTHPAKHKSVPSITNIKSVKHIPLQYWAAKECANYCADNVAKLAALDRNEIYQLVRQAPYAPNAKKAESSLVGDIVHDWIDQTIKGEVINPEVYTDKYGNQHASPMQARKMWRQFGGFQERYQPRWVISEFTVWSDQFGYAGTGDWGAYIGNALVLGDHKTGEKIYPDTAMQLAALSKADFILEADGTERPIPEFERFAILHIRPMFSRLVPVDHIDAWFRAFLGLKEVFDVVNAYEDQTLMVAPKIEVRAAA